MKSSFRLLLILLLSGLPLFTQTATAPFYDYRAESPGTIHKVTVGDLPAPFTTKSSANFPVPFARPAGAMPKVLPGFKVEQYASGLDNPRELRAAPNGDVFAAEMHNGEIEVFRGVAKNGTAEQKATFVSGLTQPFGIGFYPPGPDPQWIYIADTDAVMRYPYRNGDLKARGPAEMIVPEIFPGASSPRGHTTRDVVFSPDGKKMFIAVGSGSNIDNPDDHPSEFHRANILEFNPDGSGMRVFASGIRNPVQMAFNPTSGELWCSTNERDALGDNLVPDYTTHVTDGGFYGWPWYYMGGNHDPRLPDSHPDWRAKMLVPDVVIQPHSAPLGFAFYTGDQFPAEYHGDEFLALHGSWNRSSRTGYEVVRVPLHGTGKATGEYEDFMTGFVTDDGNVWGRPVGIAVAKDGSLLVSDDASGSIWRISYVGK